jgi:hypothetical protein
MANYATANLTKYQAKIMAAFNTGEIRFREPAVFKAIKRQTEILIPSHNAIKNAAKRTTGEINYFARSARSLGSSGEIYNHTGTRGDSAVLVPEWVKRDDTMVWSLKQANGLVFENEDIVLNEMQNMFANFAEGLESDAATFLHTNRTGVNSYSRQGSFNGDNDVFEIEEDLTSVTSTGYRALQIANSVIEANKWKGYQLEIFCDSLAYDKFQALAAQGAANSANLTFQFQGKTFVKSYELDAKAVALGYTNGYFIIAPVGTLACLDWIPEQYRGGIQTQVNTYGNLIDPNTGLVLATHQYQERANNTDNNGENQDVNTQTQGFVYLSFNHQPLTVANESPLFAFAYVPVIA